MDIGITSTVPSEVLFAAGNRPVDLNNLFISSVAPPPEDMIADAERRGLSPNLCSWVKGLYAHGMSGALDCIVVASGGDCSDMAALADLWEEAGVEVVPFNFPYRRDESALRRELVSFCDAFGTDLHEVEAAREALLPVRESLSRLDRLTWEWGSVSGGDNHRWLVSSSDFGGDPKAFGGKLERALDRALSRRDMLAMKLDVACAGRGCAVEGAGGTRTGDGDGAEEDDGDEPRAAPSGAALGRPPPWMREFANVPGAAAAPEPVHTGDHGRSDGAGGFSLAGFLARAGGPEPEPRPPAPNPAIVRLGVVGVPPIMPDLFDLTERLGGSVVYNESPFQFSMPYPCDGLVEQYMLYTYPYGARVRLASVREEVRRRAVDGLILYQEAFCYRTIQNTYIRRHSTVPTLDLEASRPGPCDARTRLRLEAFVQMLARSHSRHGRREGTAPGPDGTAPVIPPALLWPGADAARGGAGGRGTPPNPAAGGSVTRRSRGVE